MNKTLCKFLCLLLCFCILLCHMPVCLAMEENTEDLPAEENAPQMPVIEIASLEDFLLFAENCRLDSYSRDTIFRLTTDIDLINIEFDGIPVFGGIFDGNSHVILGLKISTAGSSKGLFRYLESTAIIQDLNVKGDILPVGSRSDVGGIVGINAGVIQNCTFSGSVAGSENVGAITGTNLPGAKIEDCAVEGTVSGKHFVGGIVGWNAGLVVSCTNRANVNTTAQQNQIDISDITLGILTDTESSTATTDIGGIAGHSAGILRECINYGSVGYKHMGYNVGGIVGLQSGYVVDCQNLGAISGRKEVGGIVGQQEPEVKLQYTTDTIQILKSQFAVLSEQIKQLRVNAGSNASDIKNLINQIEKHITKVEKKLDYLETVLENPRIEDLESCWEALEAIRDSLSAMESAMRKLWNAVDESITDLERDLAVVEGQLLAIESTLNNAEDNLGGDVFDVSDQDALEDLTSKVENCRNYGAILGDLNAGGIVGVISFENDLDPEEDITVVGETTLNVIGAIRSVILGCANYGSVSAKNSRIGGIVGWLSMGLAKDCVNTGALCNETADYVGGIAGDSGGFIRACMAKCAVSGDMYVGGIAGRGSVASDCYVMVQILGTERIGAIFGLAQQPQSQVEEPVTRNFYLNIGTDPGAIDGISYDGKAQGLPMDAFMQLQPEENIFETVSITFIANDNIVLQVMLTAGSSLAEIPEVPIVAGTTGVWAGMDEIDLSHILFDLTIYAEYTAYSSVIESDLKDANNRPVLLMQGDFANGAVLYATSLEMFPALQQGQTFSAGWAFTVENCVQIYACRALLPQALDTERLVLLVRDAQGNWKERAYRIEDSYVVFSLSAGDDAIALVEAEADGILTPEVLIAAAIGAGVVLAIVLVIVCVSKRRRKQNTKVENDAEA